VERPSSGALKRPSVLALTSLSLAVSCTSEAGVLKTSEQLQTALLTAKGGETIDLGPGLYDELTIKKGRFPTLRKGVVIRAADPANPPIFMKPLILRGFNNIIFRNIHWQLSDASLTHQPLVRIHGGSRISFENNVFQGIRSADGHRGYGILADDVAGLRIVGSRFTRLNRAIVVSRTKEFRAERNDIFDIGHDGFSLSDISGAIVANRIEDFHPLPGYHPDGIQFHANKQAAARDVLIQDNLIVGAADRRIQGIFMRAGYASDPSQRYRNIRIIGNIVAGSMWNGITVGQADEVEISGNKVLHLPGTDRMNARISTVAATGRVTDNQANQLLLEPSVQQSGNVQLPPSTPAEVQRLRQQWLARFRTGTPLR
jgi:hypothetical protein